MTVRAFEALFAGFAVAALLSFAMDSLIKRLAPDWDMERAGTLTIGSIFAHLGSSFLAGAAGGYTVAWMAIGTLPYVLTLAVIVARVVRTKRLAAARKAADRLSTRIGRGRATRSVGRRTGADACGGTSVGDLPAASRA